MKIYFIRPFFNFKFPWYLTKCFQKLRIPKILFICFFARAARFTTSIQNAFSYFKFDANPQQSKQKIYQEGEEKEREVKENQKLFSLWTSALIKLCCFVVFRLVELTFLYFSFLFSLVLSMFIVDEIMLKKRKMVKRHSYYMTLYIASHWSLCFSPFCISNNGKITDESLN